MYRRTRLTMIVAASAATLGAMLLIPGGERVAVAEVADIPDIPSLTSQETIATIDAMLGVGVAAPEPEPERATAAVGATPTPERDPNLRTAALTTPEPEAIPEVPAEDPALDPDLRPDSIGASAVNLRSGPSTASATIAVLTPGQPLHTGARDGGWVEVILEDGTSGWVYARYLASTPAPVQTAAKAETTTTSANKAGSRLEGRTARIEASIPARARPDGSARSVFRTERGERVKILDVRGTWLHIRTTDGSSGWIQTG
jgi:SH3-like domain-containing protein